LKYFEFQTLSGAKISFLSGKHKEHQIKIRVIFCFLFPASKHQLRIGDVAIPFLCKTLEVLASHN
jgi:hypothetical protein